MTSRNNWMPELFPDYILNKASQRKTTVQRICKQNIHALHVETLSGTSKESQSKSATVLLICFP